jgi:hypothetical protein
MLPAPTTMPTSTPAGDGGNDIGDFGETFLIEDRPVFVVGEGFAREFDDNPFINGFHSASIIQKTPHKWGVIVLASLSGFRDPFTDLIADEGDNLESVLFKNLTHGLGVVHEVRSEGRGRIRKEPCRLSSQRSWL